MFVADRMTKNPVTVTSSTKVDEAAELMREYGFRRLAVVDGGQIVGFFTDRDVMKVSPSPATTLSKYEINSLLAKMTVKEIMSKRVTMISVDATLEEAALVMYREKIGGMPVVSSVGAIVGIITETDIFKAFVDVMGLAEGKTRFTISTADKIGAVEEIASVFSRLGINIDSLVSCKLDSGEYEIIVRSDVSDPAEVTKGLEEKGYKVTHAVRIG